jgi:hypothetical protein
VRNAHSRRESTIQALQSQRGHAASNETESVRAGIRAEA